MPHAKILTKQALHTLAQLHSELSGKLSQPARVQAPDDFLDAGEAVMKMLGPDVNLRLIAPKRRNVGNPWFKRGTLYRAVVETMQRATEPMTARQISNALLAGTSPVPSRKQEEALQAAILAALRVRNGKSVIGEGSPARWKLANCR